MITGLTKRLADIEARVFGKHCEPRNLANMTDSELDEQIALVEQQIAVAKRQRPPGPIDPEDAELDRRIAMAKTILHSFNSADSERRLKR